MKLTDLKSHDIKIYGDPKFRGNCALETAELISFFSILRDEYPCLADVATHIRNEGRRTRFAGKNCRDEGMNKGASDILIMSAPGVAIELKRRDHTKSTITREQIRFLSNCKKAGCHVCVALGSQAALHFLGHLLATDKIKI